MQKNDTIAVAMSGGVDSSTVAAILARGSDGVVGGRPDAAALGPDAARRQARDSGGAEGGAVLLLDDVYDARRVAEHLGIPYYVVNQEERFEADVVRPFVSEYLAGPHADSLLALQQPPEVRPVAQDRAVDRRRAASRPATTR